LEIDVDNRRLSLGHKQLEEDPWETFTGVFDINQNHEGTIIDLSDKGAIVALAYGIEAFAPMRHLKKEDGSKVKVEDKLPFAILEFSKDEKKILVSHTKTWEAVKEEEKKAEDKATKKAVKQVNKTVEKSTLADLGVLGDLKNKLEEEEKKGK
jgi:small subunit ribosomal protein S1